MHPIGRGEAQFRARDERRHPGAVHEEWTFSWWASDGTQGGVTGYRLIAEQVAWYWWAIARVGEPLLHVTEFHIPRRADPMIAKAEAMWAEYECVAPFEQWTFGNETYAVLLDDADEALRRAYGTAVPVASDIEWYASAPAVAITDGYEQRGVVHGSVELTEGSLEIAELPAQRTHRWADGPLSPWRPPSGLAHLGLRAPFLLPDGSVIDLLLTADGWRSR